MLQVRLNVALVTLPPQNVSLSKLFLEIEQADFHISTAATTAGMIKLPQNPAG